MGLFKATDPMKPPKGPEGHLPKDQIEMIRAEAHATTKAWMRAEASAQAKLAEARIGAKFQKILEQDRKTVSEANTNMADAIDKLVASNQRLVIIVDVLMDMLLDDPPTKMDNNGLPINMRAVFDKRCEAKRKKFEAPN